MPGFNPFRNRFPYTNINDINLDWIIKKVKALSDAVASIDVSRMDEIAQQAETAQEDAETALTAAQYALTTAQSAETTANSVQGIANNALTTAQSAEITAQSAQTAATALDANKADKVQNATNGNFAGLDANGNLTDSGHNNGNYAPSSAAVPPGGTVGQVLTKTGSANYVTAWQTPSGGGGDVSAGMLAIVVNGHATPVGADAGQYVIVKNSTIEGITDGLYKAAVPIPANTVLYDTDFGPEIDNGGFNSLGGALSKYGKVLWDGNLSGAGSITVPDLDSYALIGVISGYGDMYMMIGNQTRGGTLYGTYAGSAISQLAYRFDSSNNVMTVKNDDQGITDGTHTTYSGYQNCALIRVIGLIPKN